MSSCFNMEPRLKWNKINLAAAKIILFHFRRGSMLKQKKFFKQFYFNMEPRLYMQYSVAEKRSFGHCEKRCHYVLLP